MRNIIKKVARLAVAEIYWRIGANEEDNYAKNFILYAIVPRGRDSELIVAEIDLEAKKRGGVATRILREFERGQNGKS